LRKSLTIIAAPGAGTHVDGMTIGLRYPW